MSFNYNLAPLAADCSLPMFTPSSISRLNKYLLAIIGTYNIHSGYSLIKGGEREGQNNHRVSAESSRLEGVN